MDEESILHSNYIDYSHSELIQYDGKSAIKSSKMALGIAIVISFSGIIPIVNKGVIAENIINHTTKDTFTTGNDDSKNIISNVLSLSSSETIELNNSTSEVIELTKVTQTQLEEVKGHIDTKLEKLEASIDAKLEKSKNELKDEILQSQNKVLQKIESSKKEQTNTRRYWIGLGVQVLITVLTLIVTKLFHIY